MADGDLPADGAYANIRDLIGDFIGLKILDITQDDAEEFQIARVSYVCLHFEDGRTLRFPIGDEGFQILGGDVDDIEEGAGS